MADTNLSGGESRGVRGQWRVTVCDGSITVDDQMPGLNADREYD